jgi:murein L,D-transpeptidase YcbB/YkuD
MIYNKGFVFIAQCLLTVLILLSPAFSQELIPYDLQEYLRNRIEASGIPPVIMVGEEQIYASVALPLFYEKRAYSLAWSNKKGPTALADSLVLAIENADKEGLKPRNYHLAKIRHNLDVVRLNIGKGTYNPRRLVDLDLLLTDAFLIYGSHLLKGQVDPITIDSEWFTDLKQLDMTEVLETALRDNTIIESLSSLSPPQNGYSRMKMALAHYREIADGGGWPVIPEGPKMVVGDSGERVRLLRERLIITGDFKETDTENKNYFSHDLESAVKGFQKRYGLDIDGVVGKKTIEALNVSVQNRINMIIINLERWRWLPQALGSPNIQVNIANFELDLYDGETSLIDMRVIVGRTYRRTPVFSDNMTYLVLCPHWNVPDNIARQDILPNVKRDPDYLSRLGFKVLQDWGADMKIVDPATVNWGDIAARNFKYRFRQDPGPLNALGQIKFMFPNKFNVYLHDTPSRDLFSKTSRDFSSGCIRIEKPIELAEYVLKKDSAWTREAILRNTKKNVEQTVKLPEPIPVHILYWTAWVSPDGSINFRNDIYKRDGALLEALGEDPQDE